MFGGPVGSVDSGREKYRLTPILLGVDILDATKADHYDCDIRIYVPVDL